MNSSKVAEILNATIKKNNLWNYLDVINDVDLEYCFQTSEFRNKVLEKLFYVEFVRLRVSSSREYLVRDGWENPWYCLNDIVNYNASVRTTRTSIDIFNKLALTLIDKMKEISQKIQIKVDCQLLKTNNLIISSIIETDRHDELVLDSVSNDITNDDAEIVNKKTYSDVIALVD